MRVRRMHDADVQEKMDNGRERLLADPEYRAIFQEARQ